jgi:protein phosphatase 1G
MVMEVIK